MDTLFTYDDVTLEPQYSTVKSIANISTSVRIPVADIVLDIPVISSPMDTVTSLELAKEMRGHGALGIHHRYNYSGRELAEALTYGGVAISPSMGIHEARRIAEAAQDAHRYRGTPLFCIDVAHGDSLSVHEFARELVFSGYAVVSGNIATGNAALRYYAKGVRIFRIGIGPGSACSTRVRMGVGIPQAYAISEIDEALKTVRVREECFLIADGGINHTGDIAKALALGADAVMIGRLFAGASESAGKTMLVNDGVGTFGDKIVYTNLPSGLYKQYRGMASREALASAGKTIREEGVSGWVPLSGPVKHTLADIKSTLQASLAYCGADNIAQFKKTAVLHRVSASSVRESHPRI